MRKTSFGWKCESCGVQYELKNRPTAPKASNSRSTYRPPEKTYAPSPEEQLSSAERQALIREHSKGRSKLTVLAVVMFALFIGSFVMMFRMWNELKWFWLSGVLIFGLSGAFNAALSIEHLQAVSKLKQAEQRKSQTTQGGNAMASGYTKTEIIQMLETAKSDIALFYKQKIINFSGRTTDTNEYYTEVISEWILQNAAIFEQIPTISRNSSYKVETHDGTTANETSNRGEERIAMAMFRQRELNILGKVVDYQTPLKNARSDKAGKIDLLSFDGKTLRILELKEPDSTETMLRCVVEGYTYLKTVDSAKLLRDFGLPESTKVAACPFVFYGGRQHEEMLDGRVSLERLMGRWKCQAFYIKENGGKYIISED